MMYSKRSIGNVAEQPLAELERAKKRSLEKRFHIRQIFQKSQYFLFVQCQQRHQQKADFANPREIVHGRVVNEPV